MYRRGLTRRDLLRLAGVGATSIAAGLAGCGDNLPFRAPGRSHAAIILEPDVGSFVVSAWSSLARAFSIEVRSGDGLVFATIAELDAAGQISIPVTGLLAGERYQVTLVSDDGVRLGPHHVRTAPRDDDPRPVRLAISADIDPHPDFTSDLLDRLAAASPELFVCLGDFPYADNGPGPAVTVDEFRQRHVEARTDPRIRRMLEAVGVRGIYDDHEFRNDWDAMHSAAEPARYAAAMQVWDEFFPLPGATGDIRYRRWRWGHHLECFLLDTRRFRSPNAMFDTAIKTMLGETQRTWLLDGVRRSTATFKLVLTSVPLDFGEGTDHWSSFALERDALLAALVDVPGVLFVSADQHLFAAHRHGFGAREIQVGPLCRGVGEALRTAPGVLFRAPRYNFGLFDASADALVISGVGAGGEVFYKETLTPADLTLRA